MKYINLSHEQFEHCAWLIHHAWSPNTLGWDDEEGNPTYNAMTLIDDYLTSI